VIELVEPTDSRRPFAAAVAEQLGHAGEGMFALVLQAPEPEAAAAALVARGLEVRPLAEPAGVIEIVPESAFGARLLIERATSAEPTGDS
jgi:hypothetical protein